MKNPTVLLVLLSILFLVIPIIQQMIVVKQENKHALVADLLPETDEATSEYHDSEASDLDLFPINRIKFFAFKANTYSKLSFNLSSCDKGKLESPPPQS